MNFECSSPHSENETICNGSSENDTETEDSDVEGNCLYTDIEETDEESDVDKSRGYETDESASDECHFQDRFYRKRTFSQSNCSAQEILTETRDEGQGDENEANENRNRLCENPLPVISDSEIDHRGTESPPSSPYSHLQSPLNCSQSEESNDDSSTGSEDNSENSDTSLYHGAKIKTSEFDALLLAYFKKHHSPETAKEDLMKILQLVLPDGNKGATSAYLFNKKHKGLKLQYVHHELCPTCNNKVGKDNVCRNCECDAEGLKVDPVTFYTLPLRPQIQRILHENWRVIEEYREEMAKETANFRDIQDGRVYKSFIHKLDAREMKVFSIVVSCDGAPLLKSRTLNMWPLMCFIVELPPELRYKVSNVLLTGLWYGKEKPNVPLFLKDFVTELAEECEFEDGNGEPVKSVVRIQSLVPDLPARAMLLNMKQFNGQFGCSTCKHPGKYIPRLKTRIYEYKNDLPLRTAEETRRIVDVSERTNSVIFGVKGKNVFGELLSIPDNVQIDWMHCVCEGVMKRQLFRRWFTAEFHREGYNILAGVNELDDIWLSIKVPHDLSRKPRSFSDFKRWKASEFRFFVLFAGLPCLRRAVFLDMLPSEIFHHFALLATAIRYLSSSVISPLSVDVSQVLLDCFVRLFPICYDSERVCTYNSHSLQHMPGQVSDHGSLSLTSAFVFESFIARLKSLFSGTRGIAQQMVEKLGISQTYKEHVSNVCKGEPHIKAVAEHMLSGTRNLRRCEADIFLYEPFVHKKLEEYSAILSDSQSVEEEDSDHLVSFRMKKGPVTYHSCMYPRKGNSCSYIVQTRTANGTLNYGKVICYIVQNNEAHALMLPYKLTGQDFCKGLQAPEDQILCEIVQRNMLGKHFVHVEEEMANPMLISCTMVENKCLYVSDCDGKGFLTVLDTAFEHD